MIQNSIQVDLMGRVCAVAYPTVGQKLQIESAKILFSNGTYSQLAISRHKTAEDLLDIIDAFCYFSVLVPEVSMAFTPETMAKLDFLTSDRLRKEFRKYYKFYTEFETAMLKQITSTDDQKNTPESGQSTGL